MKKYTGKNLEDALNIAASEKQVSVEDLTYTVVEETKGLFGFGSKTTIECYCNHDIMDFMRDYLSTYFTNIGLEAEVSVSVEDDFYRVNLDASNNAILIGKNGQTLQALNTVLKSAASAEFKKRVRVLIDINGYKQEKYAKVCALAVRVAKTVQRTRTDATLDPMPADERKAIHNHLTNMRYVTTVSEGEGNQRRLKIVYTPDKK